MHLLQIGLGIWLALLTFLVAVRILRGELGLRGILTTTTSTNERVINPERVVALGTFLFVLGSYALKALSADVQVGADHPQMPDVPSSLVALLAGSNTLYLAGKIVRLG